MNPYPLLFLHHGLNNCSVCDWMHRVYTEIESFLLESLAVLLCCYPPRPQALVSWWQLAGVRQATTVADSPCSS